MNIIKLIFYDLIFRTLYMCVQLGKRFTSAMIVGWFGVYFSIPLFKYLGSLIAVFVLVDWIIKDMLHKHITTTGQILDKWTEDCS